MLACLAFETDESGEISSAEDFIYPLSPENTGLKAPNKAKRGEDMLLCAQFNFLAEPEIRGYLRLYLSPNYNDYQPKERGFYLVEKATEPLTGSQGAKTIVGRKANLPQIGEALMAAAFHANGISYNAARANDPHFAHLVEYASNWLVLLAIREKDILDRIIAKNRMLCLCMAKDDFQRSEFHKSQLIFV